MSRPAGMGKILYRFLLRLRVTTQIWWDDFAEVWNKLPTTGSAIQDATIMGSVLGIGVYALHYDYEKGYSEARLAAQNGITGVIKQWLEDATGVRPSALDEPGLKEYAGMLVARHMAAVYGTQTATAWPPEPLIAEVVGLVKSELVTGDARLIPADKLEKVRKSISLVHNKAHLIRGLKGKAARLPVSRKQLRAQERQKRYRDKVSWYPYYGITAGMDAVLDDFLTSRANWTGR